MQPDRVPESRYRTKGVSPFRLPGRTRRVRHRSFFSGFIHRHEGEGGLGHLEPRLLGLARWCARLDGVSTFVMTIFLESLKIHKLDYGKKHPKLEPTICQLERNNLKTAYYLSSITYF